MMVVAQPLLTMIKFDQSKDEMNNDEISQSEDEMNNDEILQHTGPGEIVWGKYRKAVIASRIKNSKNGSLWS